MPTPHYVPEVADPLDPVTFVDKINVPTFLVCQWQDEQTGGHCPELASKFTGTDKKWFTFTNGAHIDSLDPETYNRWYDFLQLYVAEQAPIVNSGTYPRGGAGHLPGWRWAFPKTPSSLCRRIPSRRSPRTTLALAAFEELPQVRVLFENGAGDVPDRNREPGRSLSRVRAFLRSFPIPETAAQTWYFGAGGKLSGPATDCHGHRRIHVGPERAAPYQLREQHRRRRVVGQRVAVGMEVGAEPRGHCRLLCLGAAGDRHHRRRRRRRLRMGAIVDPRRRPSGDDQRGASGRERDVRAERLHASEQTQALDRLRQHVQAAEHLAQSESRRSSSRTPSRCRARSS